MRREIVSFAKLPLNDRQNARGGKTNFFREYMQTAVAGLRSELHMTGYPCINVHGRWSVPVSDGRKISGDGLLLDRNRKVYSLTRLVPPRVQKTHEKKWVTTRRSAKDIFSRGSTRRYNPTSLQLMFARQKSLKQKAPADARLSSSWRTSAGNGTGRTAGKLPRYSPHTWLKRDYGCVFSMAVICDGYDHNQTPVRADSVWSLLTLDNESTRWWLAACTNRYFRRVTPTERFPWSSYGEPSATDKEWHRMRTGTGPQGPSNANCFLTKKVCGDTASAIVALIEEMITQVSFHWQRCHELFAQQD